MTFGNPWGWWALLGVPAVVLIHFLQERSRRVRASTLFLLEHIAPESQGGSRLDRFRSSRAFWLQLLAVGVLTWLLLQPRWMKEDSRQMVAVVLDSSASMEAFRADMQPKLERLLKPWGAAAAATEWILMETDVRRPLLYRGGDLKALLAAWQGWRPRRGTHDFSESLLLARGLVKADGAVLLVTDHRQPEVGEGVAVIALGSPLPNVGFAGWTMSAADQGSPAAEVKWQALVRNASLVPQTRSWWVEWPGAAVGERRSIRLDPGEVRTLSGAFPPGQDEVTLRLEEDAFTLDDWLPLRRAEPKQLTVAVDLPAASAAVMRRMLEALDGVQITSDAEAADVRVSELGRQSRGNGIQIAASAVADGATEGGKLDPAPILPEADEWIAGLEWRNLLTPTSVLQSWEEEDRVLLWKGDRPLALVREGMEAEGRRSRRLILGWDLVASSAPRSAAMLVLLHRFLDDLRVGKPTFSAGTFDTDQELQVAAESEESLVLEGAEMSSPFQGRTPVEAGFFKVMAGEEMRLAGAAAFSDARESDFRAAETVDETAMPLQRVVWRNTDADPWAPLWLVMLVVLLLGSWWVPSAAGKGKLETMKWAGGDAGV
ncbi:MAG: BatA domain-containing protein [Verrucomicrobiales bacterium]|nr:BatA domain-containing protein [Verrucomicrobiales bacterium]